MRHVQFSYQLENAASPEVRLRNPLIDLLYALRTGGSISAAAGLLGLALVLTTYTAWREFSDKQKSKG